MSVKVLVAMSSFLFSESLKKLLEGGGDGDIEVAAIVWPDGGLGDGADGGPGGGMGAAFELLCPDVTLVDLPALCTHSPGPGHKLILIDTGSVEANLAGAVLERGVKGIMPPRSSPEMLRKAVRAVASGEVWFDKPSLKRLVSELRHYRTRAPQALSGRESEVVSLVGRGMGNKEIAERLHISEPTVKAHITRIYRKLDIRRRPELIAYAMKAASFLDAKSAIPA